MPIEYESILTWLNKINIRAECNKGTIDYH